jgi:transcriptional regulator with XRE-family HTH domain
MTPQAGEGEPERESGAIGTWRGGGVRDGDDGHLPAAESCARRGIDETARPPKSPLPGSVPSFTRNRASLHVKREIRYGCRMDSRREPDERTEAEFNPTGGSPDYVQADALGELLAQRRSERRLSLGQVSRLTGISAATLSRWERNRTDGDPHKLQILARWLGVQLDPATSPTPQPLRDPIDHEHHAGTVEYVEAHLRADRNLDSKTAAVLARLFQAAYEQYVPQNSDDQEDSL